MYKRHVPHLASISDTCLVSEIVLWLFQAVSESSLNMYYTKANDNLMEGQWQEVEACLSKKAYMLDKNLITEKQDTFTVIQDKSGKCFTLEHEILSRWTECYSNLYYN